MLNVDKELQMFILLKKTLNMEDGSSDMDMETSCKIEDSAHSLKNLYFNLNLSYIIVISGTD